MKRLLLATLVAGLLALTGCGAPDHDTTANESAGKNEHDSAERPPLIDRELFFGDPEISGAQLSPDGKYVSFIKPYRGVLVVHGANDPRVKQVESDRIVAALRDKGADVEYIVAPDEGHGFRAPGNRMALATAMEKFLAKHLGGRYQEAMSAAVAQRLDEITIDVSEVKTPEEGLVSTGTSGG